MGELITGILGSVIATAITGAPVGLYKYIQANKTIEELMRKAFENAVRKYFQDDLQKDKVIYHDTQKYIELLKEELSTGPINLEAEKYKKLYAYFKEEIARNQILTNYVETAKLDVTQDLINQNAQEVKQIVEGYAESIILHEKNITEILSRISDLSELPTFTLKQDEEQEEKKEVIALPEHISMRAELTDALCDKLKDNKVVLLYGTRQIGKSTEARLIAQRNQSVVIECRKAPSFQFVKSAIHINRDKALVVLDNLSTEYVEDTIQYIAADPLEGRFVITTSEPFDVNVVNFKVPTLYQQELPCLSENEFTELVETYSPAIDIQPVVALCANHHPILAQIACQYLQSRNWQYDLSDLEKIVKGEHLNVLRSKVSKMLAELPNDECRRLLNRILLFLMPFTEKEVIELANVEPIISQPQLRFEQLKSSWLFKVDDYHYKVSPYLKMSWQPDIAQKERVICNSYLGHKILAKKNISDIEAVQAITYYINAEQYDMAGCIYVKALTTEMNQISERSVLYILWIGVKLPQGMTPRMRYIVRVAQLLGLKKLSKERQDWLYAELMKIVDVEGIAMPNVALVYRMMSSICFFREDVYNGLRYYRLGSPLTIDTSVEEDATTLKLSEEVERYMQSGLWFMLMQISDLDKYDEWLKTFKDTKQGGSPMLPVDYTGCYFFVWRIVDRYNNELTFDEKIALLNQLMAKAKDYGIAALEIMIQFKKLELYRSARKYEEMQSIYESNMDLYKDNPLAILVFNASMGYAYFQERDAAKYAISKEYLEKALYCTEEDILPSERLHVIAIISYIQSNEDTQLALQTMQSAYDYVQEPQHFVDPYALYEAKGELVHAKWLAGDKEGAVRDMSNCIEFVLEDLFTDSPFAKTYLCKCDCAIVSYHSELLNVPLEADKASPFAGMYTELNDTGLDDEYTTKRILTTTVLMYMLCKELKIEDLKEKWMYKTIEYQKKEAFVSVEHGIMQTMYPDLLRKGDIDNAIYVCKISRQAMDIARKENETLQNTETLFLLLQLMPLLLLAERKIISDNDYHIYNRVEDLFEDLGEAKTEKVTTAQRLLQQPISEMNAALYHNFDGCKDFPLYQVASALMLINEETPIQHAYVSMCSTVKEILPQCDKYYKHEMNWVFDEFVEGYWERKIQSRPEVFEDMAHFRNKGITVIEKEQDNKAKKYLSVIYHHIKNLNVPSHIEDWLLE